MEDFEQHKFADREESMLMNVAPLVRNPKNYRKIMEAFSEAFNSIDTYSSDFDYLKLADHELFDKYLNRIQSQLKDLTSQKVNQIGQIASIFVHDQQINIFSSLIQVFLNNQKSNLHLIDTEINKKVESLSAIQSNQINLNENITNISAELQKLSSDVNEFKTYLFDVLGHINFNREQITSFQKDIQQSDIDISSDQLAIQQLNEDLKSLILFQSSLRSKNTELNSQNNAISTDCVALAMEIEKLIKDKQTKEILNHEKQLEVATIQSENNSIKEEIDLSNIKKKEIKESIDKVVLSKSELMLKIDKISKKLNSLIQCETTNKSTSNAIISISDVFNQSVENSQQLIPEYPQHILESNKDSLLSNSFQKQQEPTSNELSLTQNSNSNSYDFQPNRDSIEIEQNLNEIESITNSDQILIKSNSPRFEHHSVTVEHNTNSPQIDTNSISIESNSNQFDQNNNSISLNPNQTDPASYPTESNSNQLDQKENENQIDQNENSHQFDQKEIQLNQNENENQIYSIENSHQFDHKEIQLEQKEKEKEIDQSENSHQMYESENQIDNEIDKRLEISQHLQSLNEINEQFLEENQRLKQREMQLDAIIHKKEDLLITYNQKIEKKKKQSNDLNENFKLRKLMIITAFDDIDHKINKEYFKIHQLMRNLKKHKHFDEYQFERTRNQVQMQKITSQTPKMMNRFSKLFPSTNRNETKINSSNSQNT